MVSKCSLPRFQVLATFTYPEPFQSSPSPHPTSRYPSEYYHPIYAWVFQVVSFPQASPPKPCARPPLPIRATCPAHLILLDFITRKILGEEYRSLSYSLWSFLHSPVTLSLLGPNILLNTPFSNTLSVSSSLNVSDLVSHTYKTKGKITVLYILSLYFWIANWKMKDSAPNDN